MTTDKYTTQLKHARGKICVNFLFNLQYSAYRKQLNAAVLIIDEDHLFTAFLHSLYSSGSWFLVIVPNKSVILIAFNIGSCSVSCRCFWRT